MPDPKAQAQACIRISKTNAARLDARADNADSDAQRDRALAQRSAAKADQLVRRLMVGDL